MNKKGLETLLYSAGGVLAMAVILVAINVITSPIKARVDLTENKVYTLSKGTREILKKLDTPVKIRFYFSQPETSGPDTIFLKTYARRVEDLLAEYKKVAGAKITIEKYDPQPDSDAEEKARLDGVEPEMMPSGENVYLGIAVSMLDVRETIPFLQPNRERQLEYDLSRAITRVTNPTKPVVGIMSAMPVFGMPANPMARQMGQQGQEPWGIVNELRNDFDVRQVELTAEKIDAEIKVLLVIHPREISDKTQFAIDQFILRGGKLIAFLDPLPLIDSREQNQMFGSIPNTGSNLDKLLKAWGLNMENGKVVADMTLRMQLRGQNNQPQEAPAFLSLTPEQINEEDIVTSQIDSIWMPFAGAITGTPVQGLTRTILLKSTKNSQLVDGFMANLSSESVIKDFKPSGTEYPLAVRLTGKFKTAFPDGAPAAPANPDEPKKDAAAEEKKTGNDLKEGSGENTVIIVADADMLFDAFALRQIQTIFGNIATPMNGNMNLAQNAVEQLTGDNNLIAVRSRAVQNRPFTVVNKMQAEATERSRGRLKELEDSLAETQQQLNALQQKKEPGQRFILSPEQQQAADNFRKKESEVRQQLKEERKKLRSDIVSMQNRIKVWNIAAMPLLVTISGIALALIKRKRTSAK